MPILKDPKTGKFLKGTEPPQKGRGEPLEGDKECPICHQIFHYKRASYNDPPKTCSKECRYKSASVTGTHHIIRVCVICKKEFGIPPSIAFDRRRENSAIYCSKECRWKVRMRWTKNEKQNAQTLVRTLIKRGIIIPEHCRDCLSTEVEGHHYLGYDRENWLKVVWLCDKHHTKEHEYLRRTKKVDLL